MLRVLVGTCILPKKIKEWEMVLIWWEGRVAEGMEEERTNFFPWG